MFSARTSARRLRHLRQSAKDLSPMGHAPAAWDFDAMLDELYAWASSFPWVEECRSTGDEVIRMLAIDCPPLSRKAPWFALKVRNDTWGSEPGIFVVLPAALARKAVGNGWAVGIEPLERRRSLTVLELPTSRQEFCAMQRVLEAGYACTFDCGD